MGPRKSHSDLWEWQRKTSWSKPSSPHSLENADNILLHPIPSFFLTISFSALSSSFFLWMLSPSLYNLTACDVEASSSTMKDQWWSPSHKETRTRWDLHARPTHRAASISALLSPHVQIQFSLPFFFPFTPSSISPSHSKNFKLSGAKFVW